MSRKPISERKTHQFPPLPTPVVSIGLQVKPRGVFSFTSNKPDKVPKSSAFDGAPAADMLLQHWTEPASHCDIELLGMGDAEAVSATTKVRTR